MATGRITKRAVDAIHPGTSDVFLWDDELRGFGLKVTPAGRRSYVYQYRIGGRGSKTKRWTIGAHGSPWTAVTARTEVERLGLLVGQELDPVEAEKDRQRTASTLGFEAYLEKFVEGYLKTEWGDSWALAKRRIEMHALPALRDRPLPAIRAFEITAIMDKVQDRPSLARNLHAVLRKLFNWAVRRDDIAVSPMLKIDAPSGSKARRRVLTDDELLSLWRATYKLADPFGPYVRLLICTLQRRTEVSDLIWEELAHNERIWRLPAERAKNETDHLIPLNALAAAELDGLKWKRRGLLFTTTGDTSISGFSKTKLRLDRFMQEELQKLHNERTDAAGEGREKVTLAAWRFHDIRRTGTTRMQAWAPIEVTEAVINHRSGQASGIAGVYNLYQYVDEKRRALDGWGAFLERLIAGVSMANVVPIASARS